MRVVGVDYSLTSTGVVVIDLSTGRTVEELIRPKTRGGARLEELARGVAQLSQGCSIAMIESPALNGRSGSLVDLWGGYHVVRHEAFYRKRIPYGTANPTQVKMYATQSGRAEKDDMLAEARASFPHLTIRNDDVADALFLACMAIRWKGLAVDAHRPRAAYVIDECDWPDQTGEPVKHTPKRKKHREIRL